MIHFCCFSGTSSDRWPVAVSRLQSHLDIVSYKFYLFPDLALSGGCDSGAEQTLGPVISSVYTNMHNGSHNNYRASSNYHHALPGQAPRHRSSRFPENAPNRGNFVRGGDPVNNQSRVHDNQLQVSEEHTLFRGSERVQWGPNGREHWNRGGKFQRASQSLENCHQIDFNSWEVAGFEVDEWGREIRGRRQSPTYDERPSERTPEETPNHEMYVYAGSSFLSSILMSNCQKRLYRGQEAQKI